MLLLVFILLVPIFSIVFSTSAYAITPSNIILWNKLETGLISEYGPNGWTKFGSPSELHEAAVFDNGSLSEGIQRVGFTLWGNQIAEETPKWGQDEITIEFWAKPNIKALSNAYGDRIMFTFRKGSENAQGYVRIVQIKEYITVDGICEDSYAGYKISGSEFTHLAVSISTSTLNFYVNNELKYTSNLRVEILGTYMPYELLLGGGWMYNDWDWYGIIDNIKVFNFAKTDFSDRFTEGIIFEEEPLPEPVPPTADFSWTSDELNVDFTDESTDSDGTVESWYWDFGDGQTSSEQHPTHIYEESDSYAVTLTVTDNDGCTDSKSIDVTVEKTKPTDPIEAIKDLKQYIRKMSISRWLKNRLIDRLDRVLNFLRRGKNNAAINSLNAFVNFVEAKRGKGLTEEQADTIIEMVNQITIEQRGRFFRR